MLKCPFCKRVTEKGESTANRYTMKKLTPKGSQITAQVRCCIHCSGEKYEKEDIKRRLER